MKEGFIISIGVIGGLMALVLGGWDIALQVLIIFMAIDYITGVILAGVFKKSKKNESGALSSAIGLKGLFRKGMMLLIVLIGHQLDILMGTDFVRYVVIIAFISNELISITENAGLMGVPVPAIIKKAIDILNKKDGNNGNNTTIHNK